MNPFGKYAVIILPLVFAWLLVAMIVSVPYEEYQVNENLQQATNVPGLMVMLIFFMFPWWGMSMFINDIKLDVTIPMTSIVLVPVLCITPYLLFVIRIAQGVGWLV